MKQCLILLIVVTFVTLAMSMPARQKRRSLKNFPGSATGMGIFDSNNENKGAGLSGSNKKLENFGDDKDVIEHRSGRRRRAIPGDENAIGVGTITLVSLDDISIVNIPNIPDEKIEENSFERCGKIYGVGSTFCEALKCELRNGIDDEECQKLKKTTTIQSNNISSIVTKIKEQNSNIKNESEATDESAEEPDPSTPRICDERYMHGGNLFYCKIWKCEAEKGVGHPDCIEMGLEKDENDLYSPPTTQDPIIRDCKNIYGEDSDICKKIKCSRLNDPSMDPDCQVPGHSTTKDPSMETKLKECVESLGENHQSCKILKCSIEKGSESPDCKFHEAPIDISETVGSKLPDLADVPPDFDLKDTDRLEKCYKSLGVSHIKCQELKCQSDGGKDDPKCISDVTELPVKETLSPEIRSEDADELQECFTSFGEDHAICKRLRCEREKGENNPDCAYLESSSKVPSTVRVDGATFSVTAGVAVQETPKPTDKKIQELADCTQLLGENHPKCKALKCEIFRNEEDCKVKEEKVPGSENIFEPNFQKTMNPPSTITPDASGQGITFKPSTGVAIHEGNSESTEEPFTPKPNIIEGIEFDLTSEVISIEDQTKIPELLPEDKSTAGFEVSVEIEPSSDDSQTQTTTQQYFEEFSTKPMGVKGIVLDISSGVVSIEDEAKKSEVLHKERVTEGPLPILVDSTRKEENYKPTEEPLTSKPNFIEGIGFDLSSGVVSVEDETKGPEVPTKVPMGIENNPTRSTVQQKFQEITTNPMDIKAVVLDISSGVVSIENEKNQSEVPPKELVTKGSSSVLVDSTRIDEHKQSFNPSSGVVLLKGVSKNTDISLTQTTPQQIFEEPSTKKPQVISVNDDRQVEVPPKETNVHSDENCVGLYGRLKEDCLRSKPLVPGVPDVPDPKYELQVCLEFLGKDHEKCKKLRCESEEISSKDPECQQFRSKGVTSEKNFPTEHPEVDTDSLNTKETKKLSNITCNQFSGLNKELCLRKLCEQAYGEGSLQCIPKRPPTTQSTENKDLEECYKFFGQRHPKCEKLRCKLKKNSDEDPECLVLKHTFEHHATKKPEEMLNRDCDQFSGNNQELCLRKICEDKYGVGSPLCTDETTVTTLKPENKELEKCFQLFGHGHLKCQKLRCEIQKYPIEDPVCLRIKHAQAQEHETNKPEEASNRDCDQLSGTGRVLCLNKVCEKKHGVGSPLCTAVISATTQPQDEKELEECFQFFGKNHLKCQKLRCKIRNYPIEDPECLRIKHQGMISEDQGTQMQDCNKFFGTQRDLCQREVCERKHGKGSPQCSNRTPLDPIIYHRIKAPDQPIVNCNKHQGINKELCLQKICEDRHGKGSSRCIKRKPSVPTSTPINLKSQHCAQIYGYQDEYCKKLRCEEEKGYNHPDCKHPITGTTGQKDTHPDQRFQDRQGVIVGVSFKSCLDFAGSFDALVSCQRARCEELKGKNDRYCQFPFPAGYSKTMATFLELKNCEYTYGRGSDICQKYECEIEHGTRNRRCDSKFGPYNLQGSQTASSCDKIYGASSSICLKLKCEKSLGLGHPDCSMRALSNRSNRRSL